MSPRLIFALAPLMAVASVAAAQPGPPPEGPGMRMRHEGPPSQEMRAHVEAMKKQRVEDLRTILRLRPDQQAALDAFVAAHEPVRFEMPPPPGPEARTTPQRLQEMDRRADAMRAAHQKRRDAIARFYAALSPEQQTVFDALQRLRGGPGGGHGHRMMMVMHGGPDAPDGMEDEDGPGPDRD